ncbi:MAG: hypothetical protein RLZZ90_178 [Actinomycetota bacterium]
MSTSARPRIAILGRFSETTAVTRYRGLVTAQKLAEAVWASGGEPLTMLPVADSDWKERLRGISGILMPGGSDIDPGAYGQTPSTEHLYGIDVLQDEVDLSLVRYAIAHGIPLLTICRGTQIVNVAFGGTLVQHMEEDLGLDQDVIMASCYHHQVIQKLGEGLEVIAYSAEGHIEAVAIESKGWAFGLQWHPEDTWDTDKNQAAIFNRFVAEAAKA